MTIVADHNKDWPVYNMTITRWHKELNTITAKYNYMYKFTPQLTRVSKSAC